MLYRSVLRGYAVTALTNAQTIAGNAVFAPRDWPSNQGTYPSIFVQTYRERKESRMPGSQLPQFIAVANLSVIGRLSGSTPEAVEDQLEVFCDQIEKAILTNQPILQGINRVAWVDTEMGVKAEGRLHIGEVQMNFGLEYPADYDPYLDAPSALPPIAVPLTNVQAHLDASHPLDPNGTYPNPPFPNSVKPAPRTSGPDGRDEGALNITLPQ